MRDLHDSSRRDLATSHRTPGLRKLFPLYFLPFKRNSCLEGASCNVSCLGSVLPQKTFPLVFQCPSANPGFAENTYPFYPILKTTVQKLCQDWAATLRMSQGLEWGQELRGFHAFLNSFKDIYVRSPWFFSQGSSNISQNPRLAKIVSNLFLACQKEQLPWRGIPLRVSSLGTMILACEPFLSFSDDNCAEAVPRLLTDTMSGAETFRVSQVVMCRPRVHASFGFFKNTDLRDRPDVADEARLPWEGVPLKGESMILACGLFLSNSDDNHFVQRPCQDVDL